MSSDQPLSRRKADRVRIAVASAGIGFITIALAVLGPIVAYFVLSRAAATGPLALGGFIGVAATLLLTINPYRFWRSLDSRVIWRPLDRRARDIEIDRLTADIVQGLRRRWPVLIASLPYLLTLAALALRSNATDAPGAAGTPIGAFLSFLLAQSLAWGGQCLQVYAALRRAYPPVPRRTRRRGRRGNVWTVSRHEVVIPVLLVLGTAGVLMGTLVPFPRLEQLQIDSGELISVREQRGRGQTPALLLKMLDDPADIRRVELGYDRHQELLTQLIPGTPIELWVTPAGHPRGGARVWQLRVGAQMLVPYDEVARQQHQFDLVCLGVGIQLVVIGLGYGTWLLVRPGL